MRHRSVFYMKIVAALISRPQPPCHLCGWMDRAHAPGGNPEKMTIWKPGMTGGYSAAAA